METPTKHASIVLVYLIDLAMRQYGGVGATTYFFLAFLSLYT